MRELVLFAGAGGGVLGTQHLLGWEGVGYVEWDDYCCRVLRQRIKDGFLTPAPVFCIDIREFVSCGLASEYKGMVDVVSAGFPCQPFSVAGKGLGVKDPRNMWPATLEVIRAVESRFVFLENVPRLLSALQDKETDKTTASYFGTILGDLAACGYDVRWRCLSAAEVGASHKRDRVWIVAYSTSIGRKRLDKHIRLPAQSCVERGTSTWRDPSDGFRDTDGMADRVDRLRHLGNGQVPLVAATAWRLLTEGLA